jgi:hypothetical protein
MWAIVKDNEITETFSNLKGLVIDNIQYSRNILSFRWSEAERNAIGVYTIVDDNSNRKDNSLYTNTDISYTFVDGKVTASYGTATPKELDDVKSKKKTNIKQQASDLLTPTDWYIIKSVDVESYSVPEATTTYRADVRTASNEMEAKIDACTTVDELAALYIYTDGTRPLGEFPTLEL